ncbi:MAG: WD40/YVTN/BNR-like repeat-containing protein, partial [Longimicrobiales bacterium]
RRDFLDHDPVGLKYRCHWTPPLAIDPFEEETVYYGCNVVFRTRDRGQSWEVISPDLSTQDPERIAWSGGIPGADPPRVIGDNLGQFYGEVVFAIAPSKLERGLIWAGTNDGLVWMTRDGGENWSRISDNAPGMAEWGTIRKIEPSAFDPGTAYVVVDYHLMDDRKPYLFKVTEYGRNWTSITGDLPSDHPLDYALSLAENPNRRGMLFVGTGRGFYFTLDEGGRWTRLQDALPASPVSWIMVEPRYHDLVISTYGRGLFVLRDITRLEQADQVPAEARVHLYAPRPGFRQARTGSAEFLFLLGSDPSGPVFFQILDSGGTVVRTFEVPGQAGLNLARWDLLYDGPDQVELRTIPPYNPHIWEEARFLEEETRPIVHWGISGPQRRGPIGIPGEYTVRMTVDGETQARSFTVLKDPAITTSTEDMAASTRTQIRIRDGMNRTVDMINRLEIMRKQVEDLRADREGAALEALEALDRTLLDAELHFLSVTDLHSDDKWYVEGYKVYMQYVWLSGEVALGAGDVQGGAEYRPTDAAMAWLETLEEELATGAAAFDRAIGTAVPAFNQTWAGQIPEIVVPPTGT